MTFGDPNVALPPYVLEVPPWRRRHPVVVDANVLIADALKRARDDFSALTYLSEQRLIAVVAPTHIGSKVREHLPRVASDTGCSVELALETWEDSSPSHPFR